MAGRDAAAAGKDRISVVLADHQTLIRNALRCLLEARHRFAVTGEAADATTLPRLLARLQPRAAIVDFDLPPLGGPDAVLTARQRVATAIVIVSRALTDEAVVQSFRSGADAYVSKLARPEELPAAIEAAVSGRKYVSAPFSRRPLATWLKRAERPGHHSYEALTRRERQVLDLLAQGLSGPTIAGRFGIGARTIETHRENLKWKLGVRNQAGLIRYAVERQLFRLSRLRRR